MRARFFQTLMPVLVLLGLAGPPPALAASARYTRLERPALPAPPAGRATVVLVREQFVRAKPMPHKNLFLDRQPLGVLPQRTLLVFHATPGPHYVEASSETQPLAFRAEAGETRLFRLREVINDRDLVETSWIEDDPAAFHELVRERDLEEVRLTPAGAADLRARARKLDGPRPGEIAWLERAAAADSVVFQDILFNRPFERDDLSRAFTDRPGRLTLSRHGLVYRQDGAVFELPWSRIERIRFAGSRFLDDTPWVGFQYPAGDGSMVRAAFSDQRQSTMALTYTRVFAVARHYWRAAQREGGATVRR